MVTAGTQKHRAEKVSSEVVKMRSSKVDSIFFKCWFESYQRYGQVKDIVDIRDQLFACCDTNLIACCDTNLTCTNTCAWEWTDIKSEVELFAEIQKIPMSILFPYVSSIKV